MAEVDMNYKPNSHRYRNGEAAEPEEKKEMPTTPKKPVAKGKLRHNPVRKWSTILLGSDLDEIKDRVVYDMAIPMLKNGILDAVEIALFGGTGVIPRGSRSRGRNYNDYYDRNRRSNRDRDEYMNRPDDRYRDSKYDEVEVASRGEAEYVLDKMRDTLDDYGKVRVADLYEFADITPPNGYTGNDYGWRDLSRAKIIRILGGDGYIVRLPRATSLN